jgi:hypothetical protein
MIPPFAPAASSNPFNSGRVGRIDGSVNSRRLWLDWFFFYSFLTASGCKAAHPTAYLHGARRRERHDDEVGGEGANEGGYRHRQGLGACEVGWELMSGEWGMTF